jgi:hypothetical protein
MSRRSLDIDIIGRREAIAMAGDVGIIIIAVIGIIGSGKRSATY